MKLTAIHQLLPTYTPGDAVSDYATLLQRLIRSWGLESIIFAENSGLRHDSALRPAKALEATVKPQHGLLYHHSIGCLAAELFATARAAARIVAYHNVTPPSLLRQLPDDAARAHRGILQMQQLAGECDLALADSAFNARDLTEAGYRRVEVIHLAVADECRGRYQRARAAREAASNAGDIAARVLHVGRVFPHKRVEDVIHVFRAMQQAHTDAAGRLRIVGDTGGAGPYMNTLWAQLNGAADRVHFTGRVTQVALVQEYRQANLYLCMSRHEGFCLPLVEAMFAGLPVVARAAGAMEEVAGAGGLILPDNDAATYAELLHELTTNRGFRQLVLERQDKLVEHYTEAALDQRLRGVLGELV